MRADCFRYGRHYHPLADYAKVASAHPAEFGPTPELRVYGLPTSSVAVPKLGALRNSVYSHGIP